MAWDKTKPENDTLLINFPALCRANWDAIELLTDSNLKITNAKIADAAGISDTKLAQITTANKVNGSSFLGLSNIPSGAGHIPSANLGNATKPPSLNTGDYIPQWNGTNTKTLKDGLMLDTQTGLAANSDSRIPSQKAVKTYTDTKLSKTIANELNSLIEKTTIHDDDIIIIEDSEASYIKKKVKKSNIVLNNIDILYENYVSSGTWTAYNITGLTLNDYKKVEILFSGRVDGGDTGSAFCVRFNSDTGNNYFSKYLGVNDGVANFTDSNKIGLVGMSFTGDGDVSSVIASLDPRSGAYRIITGSAFVVRIGNSTYNSGAVGGVWLNTADQITTINLLLSFNALQVGGKIKVLGYK